MSWCLRERANNCWDMQGSLATQVQYQTLRSTYLKLNASQANGKVCNVEKDVASVLGMRKGKRERERGGGGGGGGIFIEQS